MKTKPGHFIELPSDFNVEVQGRKKSFNMRPSGIYIEWDYSRARLHYAGEQAGESYTVFEIPADPAYIKKLSREFSKLAKKIEDEFSS